MKDQRLRTAAAAVAALLVVIGCQSGDSPIAPRLNVPDLPRSDVYSYTDCQLSSEKCQILLSAIALMKTRPNGTCSLLGNYAQSRYDAAAGVAGYRWQAQAYGPDGPLNMGVPTPTDDGYTDVFDAFWSNQFIGQDLSTGALIVHEEYHHLGFDETSARAIQDQCLNWQA